VSDDSVAKAKDDAAAARARFFGTAQEIQSRLEPSHLFEDAVSDVKERSARAAQVAGDIIRERPAMFGAAAAAGFLLMVHRPIRRLGRRLFGRADETEDADAS
jgi:ElaB/YqjD/DUF883 family membrane-anchored ribosome-binding protein